MNKKPVSQWTDDECLAWGLREDHIRKTDLAKLNSAEMLAEIQQAAKQRRNQVGASAGQAFSMIQQAQRHLKAHPSLANELLAEDPEFWQGIGLEREP